MRTHGNLVRWNEERGFGFIRPAHGHEELFVHISAFPRDGSRPGIDELVSFEVEVGPNGKKRAVRVMRPGTKSLAGTPAGRTRITSPSRPAGAGFLRTVFLLLLTGALGVLGFKAYQRVYLPRQASAVPVAERLPVPAPSHRFSCDGRQHCSQMGSYAEAEFFLQNCPDTKMDGDRDGRPCEQQFGL